MTTAQSLTETIDRISVMTDRDLVPDIKRLQYQHSPIAYYFLATDIDEGCGSAAMAGAAKQMQSGGREVQFQHGVAKNSTAKLMSGIWDTFDTTPQGGFMHA